MSGNLLDTQYLLDNLGWIITIVILFLLLILRDVIRDIIKLLYQRLGTAIYKRLSGTRLFRRTAIKRYFQALEEHYREIHVLFRPNRPLILKDVYVPLRVSGSFTGAKIDSIEAVNQCPRLMVTGTPGSGKSTTLKHILLSFVSGKLSRVSNHPVPILLELNRMNNSDKSLFKELIDVLSRNNFPNGRNFIQYGLEQGTLVLLMDGLDEVNFQERSRVVQEIKDISHQYSKCRMIVTCRKAVYNGELDDITDQTLEIVEFDDRQIRQFMSSWEKDMPPDKSVNQLIGTLHDRPRIMELARNPLMLTVIAYLYCDTPHELPHSRTEFYHISTDVLLRLWHREYNEFTAPAKQSILKHLALFNQDNVQQRDRRTIDYKTIMEEIRKVLPSINLKDEDAEPLLKEIVERSGLMISINGGVEYQFAHLTLQEYFAACELGDDQEGLIQRFSADPDSWREPIKLWCGLGYDCTKLIRTIFHKDIIMAFECLADAVKVENELANTIIHEFEDRLEKNEAPEPVQKAFGAVASNIHSLRGRAVFDFLVNTLEKEDVNSSVKQAAAMALSTTNLPQAAEVLAKHFLTIQGCRSALIRMGELAVPALARKCEGENAIQYILALQEIGTPSAAEAIVPYLGDTKDDIALVAAWSLGNLMQSKSIEEALRYYKSTIPTHQGTLDWIWEPFKEPEDSRLREVCGRIAFILSNARSIPDYLQGYELDSRFSIPLCIVGLSDEAYDDIQEFYLGYSGIRFLRYRIEKELTLPRELTEKELKDEREIEREVEQKVNKALERIESPEEDASQYLKSMDKRLQLDFVTRILSGRKPTQSDWVNVLRKEVYEFDTSWHYYLILVITGILSIISVGFIGWNIYHSQTLLSYWNLFLGLLIYAIVYVFLTSLYWLRFRFIVSFPLTRTVFPPFFISRHLAFLRFFISRALALPAIGYFTTIFLLNFVSWLVVALIWVIIIGGCVSLAVIGLRKEERSRNPLKGILDVVEKLPSPK
jgi:energy-coupling factor transporter ATP-binding protein EcfA2